MLNPWTLSGIVVWLLIIAICAEVIGLGLGYIGTMFK